MVFVQIEHIQAVHNLDEILATPGLDGVVIGRNDLTGSMGKLGQHSRPGSAPNHRQRLRQGS